ncbi:hypothetical protein KIW84_054233 [Lathyrus oleraceus]|uniref:Uncharacterized protein n=1 Tax=Pisum sativum TaxID=3888 RepID=A0A9D4WTV2_PEA|nr:hypothetical protein KIW84_054233 [Pisum sativum]
MVRKTASIHVRDITSLYSTVDMIDKFHHGILFSNIRRERVVLMDYCSKGERADMDTFGDPYALYFYLHLPIIHDFGVLISFSYFEIEFLIAANVAPPQVTPNVWSILKAFQIIYCNLGVSPSIRVILYFYRMKLLLILKCFCLLESNILKAQDREDKNGVDIYLAKADGFKKLLEEVQSTLEITNEWVSQLTDDTVVSSVHHFEEVKRRVTLLYPRLELSPVDPFKVVLDGEVMDEE